MRFQVTTTPISRHSPSARATASRMAPIVFPSAGYGGRTMPLGYVAASRRAADKVLLNQAGARGTMYSGVKRCVVSLCRSHHGCPDEVDLLPGNSDRGPRCIEMSAQRVAVRRWGTAPAATRRNASMSRTTMRRPVVTTPSSRHSPSERATASRVAPIILPSSSWG